MKFIYSLVVCMMFALSVFGQKANTTPEWLKFENKDDAYTVEYPSDWELVPPANGSSLFIATHKNGKNDPFRENVLVRVDQFPDSEYKIRMSEKSLPQTLAATVSGFSLIKLEYVQWNNTETMQLKYTYKIRAGKVFTIQCLHLMTIIEGKQFNLVFTSLKETYDSYVTTAEKIMYSVKVK